MCQTYRFGIGAEELLMLEMLEFPYLDLVADVGESRETLVECVLQRRAALRVREGLQELSDEVQRLLQQAVLWDIYRVFLVATEDFVGALA